MLRKEWWVMRIFKYLKKYWFWAILAPIFMIIEVMMDLRLVNLMAELVNRGVLSQNMEIIKDIAIKMVITLLIGISGGILCGVFTDKTERNPVLGYVPYEGYKPRRCDVRYRSTHDRRSCVACGMSRCCVGKCRYGTESQVRARRCGIIRDTYGKYKQPKNI